MKCNNSWKLPNYTLFHTMTHLLPFYDRHKNIPFVSPCNMLAVRNPLLTSLGHRLAFSLKLSRPSSSTSACCCCSFSALSYVSPPCILLQPHWLTRKAPSLHFCHMWSSHLVTMLHACLATLRWKQHIWLINWQSW